MSEDTVNILIGIGGTGAKVVESALMLFAAGIGPQEVHVGLLDQDQSNGNVERTQDFLKDLVRLRNQWGDRNGASFIDWRAHKDAVKIGSVTVQPLFPDENKALWCPEKRETSLSGMIGDNLDADRQMLFNNLFMQGDEEQTMSLRKGYRGRAHVGATALVAALVDQENEMLSRLRTLMEDPGQRQVNVFLVGSAFGGTGAAGFPTLARELNRIRNDRELANRQNIHLGGILMLPYFSFNDDDGDGEAGVTSDELIPKAKLALEYYARLFEQERAFDQFFAMGWDRMIPLGYREEGAKEQTNPALVPELFAATSAIQFFETDYSWDDAQEKKTSVMASARSGKTVTWPDLPLAKRMERGLSEYLRFAFYWRYVVIGLLREKPGFLRKNWVHKLVGTYDPESSRDQMDALNKVIDDSLEWAATMQHTGGKQWSPGLWNLSDVAELTNEPNPPVKLLQDPRYNVYDTFDSLIVVDGGDVARRGGAAIYDDLDGGRISLENESKGIGAAFVTVAKATRTQDAQAGN